MSETKPVWIKKTGMFLDNVTLAIATVFIVKCLIQSNYEMAVLLLIFKGVWCISMSMMRIREHLGIDVYKPAESGGGSE